MLRKATCAALMPAKGVAKVLRLAQTVSPTMKRPGAGVSGMKLSSLCSLVSCQVPQRGRAATAGAPS